MGSLLGWIMTTHICVLYFFVSTQDPKLASYQDRRSAYESVIHVKNAFLRFVLEKQRLYCPNEGTCSMASRTSGTRTCCEGCSCENVAAQLNMCPDSATKVFEACVRPQYSNNVVKSVQNTFTYRMVTRCPERYQDDEIRRFCVQGNYLDRYNMSMVLPITDALSSKTYKNVFCAICNSQETRQLMPWQGILNCSELAIIFPKTTAELLKSVDSDNKCNILFEPPKHVPQIKKCNTSGMISECNITGRWTVFDENVELACMLYRSVYRGGYQNVFCYMCNVNQEPLMQCDRTDYKSMESTDNDITIPLIFVKKSTATLKPVELPWLHTITNPRANLCPAGSRYDILRKMCRKVLCTYPFVYEDGECQSFFLSTNVRRYIVDILISPRYNNTYHWGSLMSWPHEMIEYASIFIKKYLSPLDIYSCRVDTIQHVKSFDSFSFFHESRLTYIKVKLTFDINDVHNDVTAIKMLLNSSVDHHDISWRNNDTISFAISLFTHKRVMDLVSEPVLINGKILGHEETIPSHSMASPVASCRFDIPVVTNVSAFSLCPKLNISDSDFNITKVNNSICIHELNNLCFDEDEFEETDSFVQICSEKYFQRVEELYSAVTGNTLYYQLNIVISMVLISLSAICLVVALSGLIFLYKPRTTMTWVNMAFVFSLLLYNLVLLTLPSIPTSTTWCILSGAALQMTSCLSVCLFNVCCLCLFLTLRHCEKCILLLLYITYPVIISALVVAVTCWYTTQLSMSLSFWGLSCYFAANLYSAYISCFPEIIILAANFIVSAILGAYSYFNSDVDNEIEFSHLNAFYCKLSFLWLVVKSFWLFVSFGRWVGNIYIFLSFNLALSIFITVYFVFDSKVRSVCMYTTVVRKNGRKKNKVPARKNSRRQSGIFRQLSEISSVVKDEETEKYSSHL